MNYSDVIYDVLAADDDLTDIVKVFRHKEVPVSGIDRDTFPEVYDSNGLMLPFIVVKGRGNIPNRDLVSVEEQYSSTRQVVELWFHDDRDAGWDTLDEAANRCYALLHDQQVTDSFNVRLVNEIDEERDPELGNACLARRDYEVIGFKVP